MSWEEEIRKDKGSIERYSKLVTAIDELADIIMQIDAIHNGLESKMEKAGLGKEWEDLIPPIRVAENIIRDSEKWNQEVSSKQIATYNSIYGNKK